MSIFPKWIYCLFLSSILFSCASDNSSERAFEFVERSIAYEKQGQFRASLIEMRNAIQNDPSDASYINRYAEILTTVGSPNQAEELINSATPEIKEQTRLALANALLKQGKFVSAKHQLDQWQFDEQNKFLHGELSAIQKYLAGDKKSAIADLTQLAELNDSPVSIHLTLIELLFQNGEYELARVLVNDLTVTNPNLPELLYLNAQLHYQSGDLESSEKQLTNALIYLQDTDILLTEKIQVLELLSSVLTELGRPDEALLYSKVIRESNPEAFIAQQQYKDALNAASLGDLTTAKAAFEDILNQFPNNQQAALLLGLIHLEQGDVSQGEGLLSNNLDAETAPLSLIQATTLAQSELGKPEEAVQVLEKALLARPDDVTLLSLLGVISLNNNEPMKGIQAISKALELDSSRTRLRLLLAQYYLENEKADLALGHLRKAFTQDVSDWPTTGFYLTALILNGERTEALSVRNKIANSYADNPSALWVISMADYRLGNTESALDHLKQLHTSSPNNLNVIVALARMYEELSNTELAASMWLKALAIKPENRQFISFAVRAKSKSTESSNIARWLIGEAQSNVEVELPLKAAAVEIMVNSKQIREAREVADTLSNTNSSYAKAIHSTVLRGEAFNAASVEDWSGSLKLITQALDYTPNETGLVILASQIEMNLNLTENALLRLEQHLEKFPEDSRVVSEKAGLLLSIEGVDSAFAFLNPIWQKNASTAIAPIYYRVLGDVKPEQLIGAYQEMLAIDPNHSLSITALANKFLEQGDQNKAIEYFEKAIDVNDRNVPALNNLAWLLKESSPAVALLHAEKAATLAPMSASVLDTYGWILFLNGQNNEAKEVLDRALELAPENDEIIAHRASVI